MENNYYVYMYLREDGTPYYVGKGKGRRAYDKNRNVSFPPTKDRIKIVLENLTNEQACSNEIDFIKFYGRKDQGTGILRNLTDGGEGAPGRMVSEETRRKIGLSNSKPNGKIPWNKGLKDCISEEQKKAQRKGLKKYLEKNGGQHNKGKPMSEERKKLWNNPNPKGNKISEELKAKITETTRNLPKERWDYLKGKKATEETRRKMSESHKEYYRKKRLEKLENVLGAPENKF